MRPKLSVVVPFYGVERYIGECLTSIAAQTLTDLEVILVDDESPDGSRAIADEFASRDSRFSVVARPNGGLGPARNTGTEQATGEYLTFVDSDDIVAPFAFERMVDALDTSGSAFAAGNARRFNNTQGSRPSWSHRIPFAHTRIGSHIMEVPALARDRMVWNKVYRRSFWDEQGYEFPAIRYEDYPVTFPAHLAASSVDVLKDTVYFWRERESGDSITQQAYRFDNLQDRVTSANMVLDAAEGTTPQVREVLLHALAESDFLTLAHGFAEVPDEDFDRLRALTLELAERIGPSVIRNRHPYDHLQYRAIKQGDAALARELAQFRAGGGLNGTLRAHEVGRLRPRWRLPYPGEGRRGMPRDAYSVSRSTVQLRTAVKTVEATEAGFVLTGTADIRHVPTTADSTLTARIGTTDDWVPLAVERRIDVDSHGEDALVGFRLVVPREVLRAFSERASGLAIELTLTAGSHTRQALLHGALEGSPRWAEQLQLDDGHEALLTLRPSGHFAILLGQPSHRLVGAEIRDRRLHLNVVGQRLPTGVEFVLRGWGSRKDRTYPARPEREGRLWRYDIAIPLAELSRGRSDYDPFLEQRARSVHFSRVLAEHEDESVLAPEPEPIVEGGEDVTAPDQRAGKIVERNVTDADGRPQVIRELTWSISWGMPARTVHLPLPHGELLRITRTRGNMTVLVAGSPRPVADKVAVKGSGKNARVVVSGPSSMLPEGLQVAWTQFHPASNDPVFARAEFDRDDECWRLETPVPILFGIEVEHADEAVAGMDLADWSLLTVRDGEVEGSVLADPFANRDLPLVRDRRGKRLTINPVNDILHAAVRQHHAAEDAQAEAP